MRCNEEHVHFSVIADGAGLSFMTDTDIYTMVGNALDNAIEAVSKLENVSERIVSVSVKNNHGFIQLRVVNSYIGEILFKNDEPVTSKEDKAAPWLRRPQHPLHCRKVRRAALPERAGRTFHPECCDPGSG